MITDLRRSRRIPDYLPVSVSACSGINGRKVAGPFSGRIIDISKQGACLLMTQVLQGVYHIFYSTREQQGYVLEIHIDLPEEEASFVVVARPIWMDLFEKSVVKAFKVGVEFLVSPEAGEMRALRAALKKQQKERGAWWRDHVTS